MAFCISFWRFASDHLVVYRDQYFRIRSLALEQPLTSVPTVVTHLVLLSTLHATHLPRSVAACSP